MSNDKQIWAAHCEKHYVPLYFRSWWLDCVCGGAENWDVRLSLDGGGNVQGALLFHRSRYFGMPVIKMPPLTEYSGLWLHKPADLKLASSHMAFEKRVCENLLKQLPPHVFFYQQWHPAITNWLPFFWKGFRQTTLYSYRLAFCSEMESLLAGMNKSARQRIRQATSVLRIESIEDPSQLYRFYELSFHKQNLAPRFSHELFCRLDTVLAARNQRKILLAFDEKGNPQAAKYIVWDEVATHSILGIIHPDYRRSSAMYLLFWEALSKNYGNSQIFDFEGSILEQVEEFLRSFGGQLTPYFKIFKARNKLFQLASLLFSKEYY